MRKIIIDFHLSHQGSGDSLFDTASIMQSHITQIQKDLEWVIRHALFDVALEFSNLGNDYHSLRRYLLDLNLRSQQLPVSKLLGPLRAKEAEFTGIKHEINLQALFPSPSAADILNPTLSHNQRSQRRQMAQEVRQQIFELNAHTPITNDQNPINAIVTDTHRILDDFLLRWSFHEFDPYSVDPGSHNIVKSLKGIKGHETDPEKFIINMVQEFLYQRAMPSYHTNQDEFKRHAQGYVEIWLASQQQTQHKNVQIVDFTSKKTSGAQNAPLLS